MEKFCSIAALFFLWGGSLCADPLTVYFYPSGIQVGTTNTIIVGGQHLGGLRSGWVSGEGVEILDIQHVPNFPLTSGNGQGKWVRDWLEAVLDGHPEDKPKLPSDEALRGWNRCSYWERMDKLDALQLSLVARDHYTARNELQMSPALSEKVLVTIAASADAKTGWRDVVLYDGGSASAPHAFEITSDRRVAEPLYESPRQRKIKAAERAKKQGYAGTATERESYATPVVFDGQIMPGETDSFLLHFKGSCRVTCVVTARELLPYLGDAVPGFFNPVLHLKDEFGHELAVADDFFFLPDPVLTCDIPKSGVYTLEIHDNVYRGRQDFVYSIACSSTADEKRCGDPLPQQRAFTCFPPPSPHIPPAADSVSSSALLVSGIVDCPGRAVRHPFTVRAPGEWSFDLFARRLGSPLDGLLKLYGPLEGEPLTVAPCPVYWDDITNKVFSGSVPQVECDPRGSYVFKEPGRYCLTVSDVSGLGGEEYSYTLLAQPREPEFEVYSTKSSFVLRPGKKASFKVRVVRRNGFSGTIVLDETPQLKFEGGMIPEDKDEALVVAVPKAGWKEGMYALTLTASAETAAGRKTVPVTPGNSVEQAFAYTHVLPARSFTFYWLPADVEYAYMPDWREMPVDSLFPPHVVYPPVEMPSVAKLGGGALDAVSELDVVPVIPVPADAGDGVLMARFGVSASTLGRSRGVVALDSEKGVDTTGAVRAALAGASRIVSAKYRYQNGDEARVRALAFAATQPWDADVRLFVSSDDKAPFAGAVGAAARRLRNAGWFFDYVTDRTLPANLRGARTLYLPKTAKPLPPKTVKQLVDLVEKTGIHLLCEGALPLAAKTWKGRLKGGQGSFSAGRGRVWVGDATYLLGGDMKAPVRREKSLSENGLVWARYGTRWGESWYLVHNPTRQPVSAPWRFALRGTAQVAVMMTIDTGKIETMARAKDGSFAGTLAGGHSAWIYVSAHSFPPAGLVSKKPTVQPLQDAKNGHHSKGRLCSTCHGK